MGESPRSPSLDPQHIREVFAESQDFTIGLEEEFALVDPETLELVDRFDELFSACREREALADSVAGELIASEIEIRSGKAESFGEAVELQRTMREGLFSVAKDMGIGLAAMGTHPWANYLDQHIIDTPHYTRLREQLRWVAQRNNTWSLHLHMGIRDADRAVAVCDHLRGLLPLLLAVSANSPFLDGHDTGLHSVRTEIFTRTFPRCGVHEPFRTFNDYADFLDLLVATDTIVESTQLWWSVRPHHAFGTVELRICDAQTRGEESFAVAALIAACIAQSALDYDAGTLPAPPRQREVEENLWRAIRHGMDGRMIDLEARAEVATAAMVERVLEWTKPARESLGIEVELPAENGAQRSRRALAEGSTLEEIYRQAVDETQSTYVSEGAIR
jgi:carboxylate-amine ligase